MKPFLTIEITSRKSGDCAQIISCNVQKWEAGKNPDAMDVYVPTTGLQSQMAIANEELMASMKRSGSEQFMLRLAVEKVWMEMGKQLFPELFKGEIPGTK